MEMINGQIFKKLLVSGCNNLKNEKQAIDARNVFPVPDGDTGTNMSLTFTNGVSEVEKSGSEELDVVAKTLSRGLLMGARGNSGVILSQIFRGFFKAVKDKKEVSVTEFAEAMVNGSKMAYKAVMRPVEGTILTVVRESTEQTLDYIQEHEDATLLEYLTVLCEKANESLNHTPDLLPVLKEANVVDSGGSGLVVVFEGFKACLEGHPIVEKEASEVVEEDQNDKRSGYCTEFILRMDPSKSYFNKEDFRKSLEKIGNEIQIQATEDTVKLHIHTMTPGSVLTLAEKYGEFVKVKVESFKEGITDSILEEEKVVEEEKEFGIITVSAGDGLSKLFKEYRADVVVSGGQTMNPSTEDICAAIDKVNAKHIYVLPNNSNIIMAAQQAATVTEDKDIIVLETKAVTQGLSACIAFNPDASVEENTEAMKEAISLVKTGQVTYAVKDTNMNGVEIHAGDYMGLFNKEIKLTAKDKVSACQQLVNEMIDEDSEIVTLLVGEDATEEEVNAVSEYITNNYEVDVDVQNGGQPVYCFIVGVE